jgi:hypothetical protein
MYFFETYMKKFHIILIAVIVLAQFSCNKETPATQTDVMNNMLTNKTWYLDYSITGSISKSYVGQSTYFVTYLKDGTLKDSDGLIGTYTVENIYNQSQIHVQVKTLNGNSLEVIYDIISVGANKMILSKQVVVGAPTHLYFTSK